MTTNTTLVMIPQALINLSPNENPTKVKKSHSESSSSSPLKLISEDNDNPAKSIEEDSSSSSAKLIIAEDLPDGEPIVGKKGKPPKKEDKLKLSNKGHKVERSDTGSKVQRTDTGSLKKSNKGKEKEEDIIILASDSDVADLMVLGFSEVQVREALLREPNNKDAAVNYLIENYPH